MTRPSGEPGFCSSRVALTISAVSQHAWQSARAAALIAAMPGSGVQTIVLAVRRQSVIPTGNRPETALGGKARDGCLSDLYILIDTSPACSHGPDHHAIPFYGDPSAKDYNPGVVGRVETKALLATLR